MPPKFQTNLNVWKDNNPNSIAIKLWNAPQLEQLFQHHYPTVYPIYKHASPIQKSDMARYAILAHHGGWYFDLDASIHCGVKDDGSKRQRTTSNHCLNDLTSLLSSSFFKPKSSGTLFWERGPLSPTELLQSTHRPCRRKIPEYKHRLANYAMHAATVEGQRFFLNVLHAAACRVTTLQDLACSHKDQEYSVLFSTGPDVLTEVAYGNRRVWQQGDPVGNDKCVGLLPVRFEDNAHTHRMNVVDPKAMVLNANSFSWRGKENAAFHRGD
jgi:hypothetical protein